jgi:hypothetical protein
MVVERIIKKRNRKEREERKRRRKEKKERKREERRDYLVLNRARGNLL